MRVFTNLAILVTYVVVFAVGLNVEPIREFSESAALWFALLVGTALAYAELRASEHLLSETTGRSGPASYSGLQSDQ